MKGIKHALREGAEASIAIFGFAVIVGALGAAITLYGYYLYLGVKFIIDNV